MILTAAELLQENLLRLGNSKGAPAQVGYDLSLKSISLIKEGGAVFRNRSTMLPDTEPVNLTKIRELDLPDTRTQSRRNERKQLPDSITGWSLQRGQSYELEFYEGITLPSNRTAFIRQRSSLLRSGIIIHSSVFDPGFSTRNIGCILFASSTFFIQKDARVAQIYFHTHTSVAAENLYDGQFNKDKQRK